MSDSLEFTLHNPLSKEDWDKLTDVELEKTEHIWFETPSGKKVDYISAKVLNKLRAEIEDIAFDWQEIDGEHESFMVVDLNDALRIIDKYVERNEQ